LSKSAAYTRANTMKFHLNSFRNKIIRDWWLFHICCCSVLFYPFLSHWKAKWYGSLFPNLKKWGIKNFNKHWKKAYLLLEMLSSGGTLNLGKQEFQIFISRLKSLYWLIWTQAICTTLPVNLSQNDILNTAIRYFIPSSASFILKNITSKFSFRKIQEKKTTSHSLNQSFSL
jgi:hypothetical protein